MTTGILKSMDRREKMFIEQLGKNDAKLTEEYRRFRNKVSRTCQAARDLDDYNSFIHIINDPKKVWCKLNKKYLNKTKISSALPSELVCGDTKITEEPEILNKLNEHFALKGHILATNLPHSDTPILNSMKPRNNFCVTNWRHTQPSEIIDIVKSEIHTNKSTGFDGVPAILIKWSADIISSKLTDIFNRSFDIKQYPRLLKIARVVALHKGGDRSKVENYRPISVLTHLNKIFEKLLHVRINERERKFYWFWVKKIILQIENKKYSCEIIWKEGKLKPFLINCNLFLQGLRGVGSDPYNFF